MTLAHVVGARELAPSPDRSQLAVWKLDVTERATRVSGVEADTILLCVGGTSTLACDGTLETLEVGTAAMLRGDEKAELVAEDSAVVMAFTVGCGTDVHAPLGARARIALLDRTRDDAATGKRAFQVLFGPENDCSRATLFVGYVPPGKASWHYHLYDEIVWIWDGEARYHFGETTEELHPGSAIRIRSRDVHIVENSSQSDELVLVGFFTPAGSPSAAYLPAQEPRK